MDVITFLLSKKYTDSVALHGVAINYPQIDSGNQHWKIFNPATNTYIDTGCVARGVSPRIDGATKNWLLWDDNTNAYVSSGVLAQGQDGYTPQKGVDYFDGVDGRQIELTNDGANLKWRYMGDAAWNTIIAIANITGKDGESPVLRVNNGVLQWKYQNDAAWQNLYTFPQEVTQSDIENAIRNHNEDETAHGIDEIKKESITDTEIQKWVRDNFVPLAGGEDSDISEVLTGSASWIRVGCKGYGNPLFFDIVVDPDTDDFMQKVKEFNDNVRRISNIQLGAGLFKLNAVIPASGNNLDNPAYSFATGILRGIKRHDANDNLADCTVIQIERPVGVFFSEISDLTLSIHNYDGANTGGQIFSASRVVVLRKCLETKNVGFYVGQMLSYAPDQAGTALGIFSFEQSRCVNRNAVVYMGDIGSTVTNPNSYFYGHTRPVIWGGYLFTHTRTNWDNSYIRVGDFYTANRGVGIFGYPVSSNNNTGLRIEGQMTDKVRDKNTNQSVAFRIFSSRSIMNCHIVGRFFLQGIASTGNITGGDDYKGNFIVQLTAGSVFYTPSNADYSVNPWVLCVVDRMSSARNQWVKGYWLDCSQAVLDVSDALVPPLQIILDNSSQDVDGMVYRAVPQQGNSAVEVTPFVALN